MITSGDFSEMVFESGGDWLRQKKEKVNKA